MCFACLVCIAVLVAAASLHLRPRPPWRWFRHRPVAAVERMRQPRLTAYVINLDASVGRMREMRRKLAQHPDLAFERIAAVSPDAFADLVIARPESCRSNTPHELACTLSHIRAIHRAFNQGRTLALVLEDDVVVQRMPDWARLVANAPADWEVLQLHTLGPQAEDMYRTFHASDVEWREHEYAFWSTAAYLIRRPGMEKMLRLVLGEQHMSAPWERVPSFDFSRTPTNCIADHMVYNVCRTYTHTRPCFNVEGVDSTIHQHHVDLQAKSVALLRDLL